MSAPFSSTTVTAALVQNAFGDAHLFCEVLEELSRRLPIENVFVAFNATVLKGEFDQAA